MPKTKKSLIVILGPTASGKSSWAVKLAKKFGGEIVSADSRQIYKGMDIGTGKITKSEMEGIPHHLLDIVSPKSRFSAAHYQKIALRTIENIFTAGKVPILCGGTAFYIQSVVDGILMPEVKPDWKLRKKLEKIATDKLYRILKNLDPERAKNIDKYNPRRLIRAIEIVMKTKNPVPEIIKKPFPYPVLMIGIKKPQEELKKLIEKRLLKRLKQGMVLEIKKLRRQGVSWKRLEEFGLEYRYVAMFLQNKISYQEMAGRLQKEIEHFAKRQMTWWKKDKRIKWIKSYKEAELKIKNFFNKKGASRL